MLTSTLGGLIKDFRLKKRLSQQDVSLRIGWKDTTRLSKIEQGRVGKPTRVTIEKIIKALDLNEQETGEFLLTGGYLPTEEEIKKAIKEISYKIDAWPYPAFVLDFSFRWLHTNIHTLSALNLPLDLKKSIIKGNYNFLEYPFMSKDILKVDVFKGEDENNLKPLKIAQIASFKTENSRYQNESWYKKTVQSLMKYDEFRHLWATTDQKDYLMKVFDMEYKRITGKYDDKNLTLNLYLFTSRLINDPRFQLVFCYPADKDTYSFFTNTV